MLPKIAKSRTKARLRLLLVTEICHFGNIFWKISQFVTILIKTRESILRFGNISKFFREFITVLNKGKMQRTRRAVALDNPLPEAKEMHQEAAREGRSQLMPLPEAPRRRSRTPANPKGAARKSAARENPRSPPRLMKGPRDNSPKQDETPACEKILASGTQTKRNGGRCETPTEQRGAGEPPYARRFTALHPSLQANRARALSFCKPADAQSPVSPPTSARLRTREPPASQPPRFWRPRPHRRAFGTRAPPTEPPASAPRPLRFRCPHPDFPPTPAPRPSFDICA